MAKQAHEDLATVCYAMQGAAQSGDRAKYEEMRQIHDRLLAELDQQARKYALEEQFMKERKQVKLTFQVEAIISVPKGFELDEATNCMDADVELNMDIDDMVEHYFEEVFAPVEDRNTSPPPPTPELIDRLLAAGPKYGIRFLPPE